MNPPVIQPTINPPGSPLAQRLMAMAPAALAQTPPETQLKVQQAQAPTYQAPAAAPVAPPVNPTAAFPVYSGAPTAPPTGLPWISDNGNPVINGRGEHLDTGGNPMPANDNAQAQPAPVEAPAPVAAAEMIPDLTKRPRRKTKAGETAEAFAERLAAWERAKAEAQGPAPANGDAQAEAEADTQVQGSSPSLEEAASFAVSDPDFVAAFARIREICSGYGVVAKLVLE